MKQEFTSKNTSINTKKLPAIYNKIDWEKCRGKIVFDFGCGKQETINRIQELLEPYDVEYIGYDRYHQNLAEQTIAFERRFDADIYICSNVLCVIKEYENIQRIIDAISRYTTQEHSYQSKAFFFKIYEGDKTGQGRQTKKDCWQRNQLTKDYINLWDWTGMNPLIYKGIITNLQGKTLMK